MTATPRRVRAACLGIAALLVLAPSGAHVALATASPGPTDAERAALAAQQEIDRETGAFDAPVLLRLRARTIPSPPGPRGLPPETEQRNCPSLPAFDTFVTFC